MSKALIVDLYGLLGLFVCALVFSAAFMVLNAVLEAVGLHLPAGAVVLALAAAIVAAFLFMKWRVGRHERKACE